MLAAFPKYTETVQVKNCTLFEYFREQLAVFSLLKRQA